MIKSKTPFNWVGNKYKFMGTINEVIKDKEYNNVIELFMGSGNILLNIDVEANVFIGNDKIKLLPMIYSELKKNKYTYTLEDIENIINKFDRFSTKDSYYTFRDYWNGKYLNDKFDRDFTIETILLLKMCSNSMVRFNPKQGYFNQGFRGLGKKEEFFTETMKRLCIEEVNKLSSMLQDKEYRFCNNDFLKYKDSNTENGGVKKDLLIVDPPYILRKDMYDTDWTERHDEKLFELLKNTNNDFIYFNYLERDGVINEDLLKFISDNNLKYIEINNKTLAGQGRSENIKSVKEVIVTNV